jgi:predicted nucleotidyltransferase
MSFGLPERTLNEIRQCLARYPRLDWVKVYGSRAMGSYEPGSDIDLAYSGPEDITAELLTALDELPTPYLFDVTYYDALTHEGLKAHIDRVGQFLVTRTERC